MRLITLTILIGLIGLNVSAETNWVDDAIQAEIEEETGSQADQKGTQNIYIVNKNDSEAKAKNLNNGEVTAQQKAIAEAQNQPETIVEASPVVESYATNLRKLRQDAEINTEQKIVEKLESARLEDERKRAQRLFGHKKFESNHSAEVVTCQGQGCWVPAKQAQVIKKPVHVKTVQVVEKVKTPAHVVVPTINYETKPKSSIYNIVSKTYLTGSLGGVYYDAENVESKLAYQIGLGIDLNTKTSIEANFSYSQHRVDEYFGRSGSRTSSFGFTELDQYNWGVDAKYNLLSHNRINVYAGAHLGVVYRNYYGVNKGRGHHGRVGTDSEESTRSINIAPVFGAEFNLTRNISVGVDYKYMINVDQDYSSDDLKGHSRGSGQYVYEPLEEIEYGLLSVKAKLRF